MYLLTASTKSKSAAAQVGRTPIIVERIRGEFREMPGLTLTLAQAGRLWSLDQPTCGEVLTQLVEAGFLCRTSGGAFCRSVDRSS